MPKGCKRIVYIYMAVILSLTFISCINNCHKVQAKAIGTVNVNGCLNVREGPSTSYSVLRSGGTKVTLSNGQKVSIISQSDSWYYVSFKLNGRELDGYVSSAYIKVYNESLCTFVKASVLENSIKLMNKASEDGGYVKSEDDYVILAKDENVFIKDEVIEEEQKWYYVSCVYSGNIYNGYIEDKNLYISYEDGISGIWEGDAKTPLYKNAGKNTVVKKAGKKIKLNIGKQFTVLSEKTVSDIRYFYVKVWTNKTYIYGYVPALYSRFQIVSDDKTDIFVTPSPSDAVTSGALTSSPVLEETESPVITTSSALFSEEDFKTKLENNGFPESYIKPLLTLHEKYPYWDFETFDTGLDWETVIDNEAVVGANLLSNNKSYDWKSTADGAYDWKTDKYIPYDGSTWVTASVKAIKYYMDPRNFLDERGIFQFESLEYHSETQTKDGVEKILNNTPMSNTKFSYTNSDGKKTQIKYSEAFMTAAKSSNVSPYHLASRVKQEVVISPTLMSSSVSGTVSGYEGIYNFYNIGAYSSTSAGGAIANGLKWASSGTTYNRPWNNRLKSITGGAEFIGENYINIGQNTLYLEKFNVTSTNRYDHQYMTNVEAPNSEATKTVSAYGVIDADMPIKFSIPIYNNMPDKPCEVPSGGQNPNNYLKNLYVEGYSFTSPFVLGDDGSKIYKLNVDKSVKSIKICATKVSEYASIKGKGTKELSDGTNTFTVKVTSESGNTRKYTIKVTRN